MSAGTSGSIGMLFSGAYSETATVYYHKCNNIVHLSVSTITGTTGFTSSIYSNVSFPLPAAYRPSTATNFAIYVVDNSVGVAGRCEISTAGVLTIYVGYNTNFQNGVTCGWPTFAAQYYVY